MRSSSSTDSTLPHRGHKLVIFSAIQTLVILWLGAWAIGDYLNNEYVKAYVDGTIQANTLLIGAVFAIGIAGSIGGLFLKRRSHGTLELVNVKGSKGSGKISTPVITQKMGGSSGSAPSSTPAASSGSSVELHPAVVALKQEMSERRMSLGMPGMMDQGQGPTGASHAPNSPSSVASMLPPDIRALAQAPKPALQPSSGPQQGAPMLQTVPPPPPMPHPPMQTLPVARPGQPTMPMVRQGPPNMPPHQPVQPIAAPPMPPRPATVIPQNVTTVITGIMPKKKDPNQPDDEKSSGQ